MSESGSAFSFWRDRDQPKPDTPSSSPCSRFTGQSPTAKTPSSSTKPHHESRAPVSPTPPRRPARPPPPLSVSLSAPSFTCTPRSPPPPGRSAADSDAGRIAGAAAATRTKVPLLPPKLRKTSLDGPSPSGVNTLNARSKFVVRTTQHAHDDSEIVHRYDNSRQGNETALRSRDEDLDKVGDLKSVSDIVTRLNLHSPPGTLTTQGQGGPNKFLPTTPQSVPPTSSGKKFLLPPGISGGSSLRVSAAERRVSERDEGGIKRASESVARRGRGATVREVLKKREREVGVGRGEGEGGRMEEQEGAERTGGEVERNGSVGRRTDSSEGDMKAGSGGKESLHETRSLSGSRRRNSGSVKIKSSWTCYLDGPEDQTSPVPPPSPSPSLSRASPSSITPQSSVKSTTSHTSHSPLSPSPSLSLLQTFSESFRTSNNQPAHNYLRQAPPHSDEALQFWKMVESLRKETHRHRGHFSSPLLSTSQLLPPSPALGRATISVRRGTATVSKVKVHIVTVSMVTSQDDTPIIFQCSAESTVKDVVSKGFGQGVRGQRSSDGLWLKVCGKDEYLDPARRLVEYVYVHHCLKLGTEVKVQVMEAKKLPKSLACPSRSPLPPPPSSPEGSSGKCIAHQELNTLLDSYVKKEAKFVEVIESHSKNPSPVPIPALVQSVISCVKLLCERLLFIEPASLSDAVYNLRRACKSVGQQSGRVVGGKGKADTTRAGDTAETDDSASVAADVAMDTVSSDDETAIATDNTQEILSALKVLRESVHHLVSLYCLSLHPGYLPEWWAEPQETVKLSIMSPSLRVRVCAIHRLPLQEYRRFPLYLLEACLYHGGLPLSKKIYSPPAKITRNFFSSIVWNKWLNFGVPLSHLPRECRLCCTVHGLESAITAGDPMTYTPMAWVTQRLFSCEGVLIFGPRLLGLWGDDRANPLDSPYSNMAASKSLLLELVFEDYGERVVCDSPPSYPPPSTPHTGPPSSIYRGLKKMAERDRFSSLSIEDERLIWTNRFLLQAHLGASPRGLPLLLLSTPQWHSSHRDDVWSVLGAWPCSNPVYGLELLDAQLADGEVRKTAVYWLSDLPDDDLCDFLPQLVQSLRHDAYEASPMAQLLLSRALSSPRLAHSLYWHLRILATAQGERYATRYQHMMRALELLCGERLKNEFNSQVELVEQLVAVAAAVKVTRDAHRQTVLVQELQRVGEMFVGDFRLPLSSSLLVRGLDIESSSFFNSNTVPLKLSFLNSDPHGENIDIIFKVGDDLRQDILILQMIKLMEKVWLRAGLDLKMITYDCVATGPEQGMLEIVTDSATLRTIQTEHGVTGSFKDKPLSEWLMRNNPTDSAYKKAVDNFTYSCAGYCVATYILGICDRHNDNIMVKKTGHMFHIDFGKILGNAQMFGSIKRDRVPFVLTRDMAYVINDGDKPTSRFQQFVDLCCTAYNELRRHSHTLLSLLSLMLSSGLAELSSAEDILYVRDALLPGRSEAEATYAFTKHIEDSLGSLATQINFFIHNLAQLKFSSPQAPPTLLTFVPQAYSIETDGKIQFAVIVAYYKRYYPETHTVYQIQVTRDQSLTTLFRRYREFDELHKRLVLCFPSDSLPNFPGKTFLPGKSRTRETAEKRLVDLNSYLNDLLGMEARISESDVVYTFFHCLIRDEQDKTKMEEEGVNEEGMVAGKVKVHMSYDRRAQSLSVMVRHVKDLVPREGSDYADPYVKMYLLPDPTKSTKQKTKIAKRTLHPTYNESFTYKVPPHLLPQRKLDVSVWDASILLNKQCLATATVDLVSIQSELANGCSFWVELHSPAHTAPNR